MRWWRFDNISFTSSQVEDRSQLRPYHWCRPDQKRCPRNGTEVSSLHKASCRCDGTDMQSVRTTRQQKQDVTSRDLGEIIPVCIRACSLLRTDSIEPAWGRKTFLVWATFPIKAVRSSTMATGKTTLFESSLWSMHSRPTHQRCSSEEAHRVSCNTLSC